MNRWNQIHDFTKPEDGTQNWDVCNSDEWALVSPKDVKEDLEIEAGDWIFEYSNTFAGGTLEELYAAKTKDSLMAFDIKTDAKQAQFEFEAKGKPASYKNNMGAHFAKIKLNKAPEAGTGVELEDAELKSIDWEVKTYAPPPPDGFRFVYVDELKTNSDLENKVKEFIEEDDHLLLVNGVISGEQNDFEIKETTEDFGHEHILVISANYPI